MATPPKTYVEEDCPSAILADIGAGFSTGAVGGTAFYFLKGAYNSPSGGQLVGGSQAVLKNVPRVAGSWAIFCGLHTALERTMIRARGKEDPWNSIIAGAAACGVINLHRGLPASAGWALFGGVGCALMEGAQIMLDKMERKQNQTNIN